MGLGRIRSYPPIPSSNVPNSDHHIPPLAQEVIQACLCLDPASRCTAQDALSFPFLLNPTTPTTFPDLEEEVWSRSRVQDMAEQVALERSHGRKVASLPAPVPRYAPMQAGFREVPMKVRCQIQGLVWKGSMELHL